MDNKELIKKYPFLLPRDYAGNPLEDYDYSFNEMELGLPKGWWKRWGILWCQDLLDYCIQEDINPENVILTQVKEKYGQLRIYHNGLPESWSDHEYAWEYISERTCIDCGKFPVQMRDDGWLCPYCDECFAKKHSTKSSETLKKWTIEEDDERLREYLIINTYSYAGKEERLIDMKPYYKLIGWNFSPKDLISLDELRKIEKEKASS